MNQGTPHPRDRRAAGDVRVRSYRKQWLAIEEVARTLATMEQKVVSNGNGSVHGSAEKAAE